MPQPQQQHRDVVIVGAGLAGLSAALYLTQVDPTRHVTIVDREDAVNRNQPVASYAAAGMLAPHSERLPAGPLLDLCLESRRLYADFVQLVEGLAQQPLGLDYLEKTMGTSATKDSATSDLQPWQVGYRPQGGFLAPAFAGDVVATWAPPDDGTGVWLEATALRELEPHLSPEVIGGWWFPHDASVDARRLTRSLKAACVAAGVDLLQGPGYHVESLNLDDTITSSDTRGLRLTNGMTLQARAVLVANGAWMQQLVPVPMQAHKGQSLALRVPAGTAPILKRVLFAQDSYIVPQKDRIIVGATVEAGCWDANVTPAGLLHLLHHALQVVPGLAELPIDETWVGLRPTTPDKGPILGATQQWKNVYVAGGYWRNGVLLAPKTGQLMAQVLAEQELSVADQALLDAFNWQRFYDGNSQAAANARYAAAVHPVQTYSRGAGVAAAVGTELGSYSTARSAQAERHQDRKGLFRSTSSELSDDDMARLEEAAAMGKRDAGAYRWGNDDDTETTTIEEPPSETLADDTSIVAEEMLEDKPEETSEPAEDDADDLSAVYATIRANKQKAALTANADAEEEERPDPGFRIYYLDETTNTQIEVPPYTTPEAFHQSLQQQNENSTGSEAAPAPASLEGLAPSQTEEGTETETEGKSAATEEYTEKTFDGYTVIQEANARSSRLAELDAMRQARQANRQGYDDGTGVDTGKIGVVDWEKANPVAATTPVKNNQKKNTSSTPPFLP